MQSDKYEVKPLLKDLRSEMSEMSIKIILAKRVQREEECRIYFTWKKERKRHSPELKLGFY